MIFLIFTASFAIFIYLRFKQRKAKYLQFYKFKNGKKRRIFMASMTFNQKIDLSIAILDRKGNPAKVDGAPVWALSDDALGELSVAADGLSASFKSLSLEGNGLLSVTCDADLGEGVEAIVGTLPLVIASEKAVEVKISASEPVDA
jgi:hypothetical protein